MLDHHVILNRLDYRQTWDKDLRDYIKTLDEKKPVVVCGDLNVAHKEIGQNIFLIKNSKISRLRSCQPQGKQEDSRIY